jgi:prophage regulatory protein
MTTPSSKTPAGLRLDPVVGAVVPPPDRLLRFLSVRARTGLSRSTIRPSERQGDFPRHRCISAHAVAWLEAEIERLDPVDHTEGVGARSDSARTTSAVAAQGGCDVSV